MNWDKIAEDKYHLLNFKRRELEGNAEINSSEEEEDDKHQSLNEGREEGMIQTKKKKAKIEHQTKGGE